MRVESISEHQFNDIYCRRLTTREQYVVALSDCEDLKLFRVEYTESKVNGYYTDFQSTDKSKGKKRWRRKRANQRRYKDLQNATWVQHIQTPIDNNSEDVFREASAATSTVAVDGATDTTATVAAAEAVKKRNKKANPKSKTQQRKEKRRQRQLTRDKQQQQQQQNSRSESSDVDGGSDSDGTSNGESSDESFKADFRLGKKTLKAEGTESAKLVVAKKQQRNTKQQREAKKAYAYSD